MTLKSSYRSRYITLVRNFPEKMKHVSDHIIGTHIFQTNHFSRPMIQIKKQVKILQYMIDSWKQVFEVLLQSSTCHSV